MSSFAGYFHKGGMLAHTPRSGFAFFGSGEQAVAEHSFRTLHIAFVLNRLVAEPADELHLMKLVLFHDLPEARTSDLNYENQKYVRVEQERRFSEMENELPYGTDIVAYARDYEERQTLAARLDYDADQLEFLVTVKEELDKGNPIASDWIPPCLARLKSDAAKQLAGEILHYRNDE